MYLSIYALKYEFLRHNEHKFHLFGYPDNKSVTHEHKSSLPTILSDHKTHFLNKGKIFQKSVAVL